MFTSKKFLNFISKRYYFLLPKTVEKSIIIGIISSRPISIVNERTTVEKSENTEKFPIGPTTSNPGPTLFSVAITADAFVSNEKASIEINSVESKNIAKYTTIYPMADLTVSLATASPSSLTTFTDLGLRI